MDAGPDEGQAVGRMAKARRKSKVSFAAQQGRVIDLAHGGDAVVETDKGRVFVPFGVPGDEVVVDQISKRRGVLRGRLAELRSPSSERRQAPCADVERCGGCRWMLWNDEAQRSRKARYVQEALRRFEVGEVDVAHAEELGYRTRARLAFSKGRIGYRRPGSRDNVDVAACVVLVPVLGEALGQLRSELGAHLKGSGELILALRDEAPVAVIRSEEPQGGEVYAALEALVASGFAGAALQVGDAPPAVVGELRERRLGVDDLPVEGTVGGFSQAHGSLNGALVTQAAAWANTEGRRVLELHAGHGNLTVAMAPGSRSYVAVEIDKAATEALRENLKLRGTKVRAVNGSDEGFPKGTYDVVVLDPPRRGAPDAVRKIAALRPRPEVVYVSCDPMSLARDAAVLVEAGWKVQAVKAFDMFPQTPHVETVLHLRPA